MIILAERENKETIPTSESGSAVKDVWVYSCFAHMLFTDTGKSEFLTIAKTNSCIWWTVEFKEEFAQEPSLEYNLPATQNYFKTPANVHWLPQMSA